MANTSPVIDSKEYTEIITTRAKNAPITILPIAAVTIGQQGRQLTDFASLKSAGAVALSDDGIPIVSDEVMNKALRTAALNDILIISHCEEEAPMAARDIRLAEEIDANIHIAHVSTADTVEIIREAKARGVKVTAETCPHYFSLTEAEVEKKGTLARMSPPLRTLTDVEAIIQGLADGTIEAIATDHAPHSAQEKALPFDEAPNGIIGLETSLALALTYLYHTEKLRLDEVIDLMSKKPANILKLNAGTLKTGDIADLVIFDPNEEWTVDPLKFRSKSKNSPFIGMKLRGKVKYTISQGRIVFDGNQNSTNTIITNT
jgi:dihydroorotase